MSLDTLEVEVHLIIRNKETQAHAPAFGRGIARLCEGVERTGSLNKACKEMGMAYIFISHDLSVIKHISDRIMVMYEGRVMGELSADEATQERVLAYSFGHADTKQEEGTI